MRPLIIGLLHIIIILIMFVTALSVARAGINSSTKGSSEPISETPQPKDTVVLLHGIARTSKSMDSIKNYLEEDNYEVINITYPSLEEGIEENAIWLKENIINTEFFENRRKVHFVTHSMGGLIVRGFLNRYKNEIPQEKLGRIVMLAPPNQGSEVADLLSGFFLYDYFYGLSGTELTSSHQGQKANEEIPYYELGIIAGNNHSLYPISSLFIEAENDGRVSVLKTKLNGMKEHIVIDASHSLIINNDKAHDLILSFLTNGKFGE